MEDWIYKKTGETIKENKKLDFVNDLILTHKAEVNELLHKISMLEEERDYYKNMATKNGALMRQKPIPNDIIEMAKDLREKRYSYREIAEKLNISKSSVWNVLNNAR